jgi:exopolysaccharide biosynthesis polyprenyl glycosylphosphotransferase
LYGIKVLDTYDHLQEVLAKINPEEVIITISTTKFDQIRGILEVCETEGVQVRLNSDFFGQITTAWVLTVDNVYGLNIISFNMLRHSHWQLFAKRLIDIIGATVALILFSPFMLMAVLGIWITDGLPILYEWNVVGLNRKPFKTWKFRTMVVDADAMKKQLMPLNEMDGPVFKIKNDPRITRIGKFLRKYSLDELPQLWSVLRGDMSLVGPRPAAIDELGRYESWHRRRLSIKPGITCIWQISGRNEISDFDDWVRMDLEYVDNWSLWLDIKILLRTIPAVISTKGAS